MSGATQVAAIVARMRAAGVLEADAVPERRLAGGTTSRVWLLARLRVGVAGVGRPLAAGGEREYLTGSCDRVSGRSPST